MGTTQLEIIRRQAQAAVQNKVSGAQARIRRETSLVAQASRLTGRALREGETALKGRRWAAGGRTSGTTVETTPAPVHPAEDGYIRRSPVQPVFQAADYHRRLVARGVLAVVLIAVALAGVYVLGQLGILGR